MPVCHKVLQPINIIESPIFINHNKIRRIVMTKKLDTTFIQIVHPVCCGLDMHKKKYPPALEPISVGD